MASLAPYSITLGATDYPVKYAGLLAYIEPYLTNLETFSFSGPNVGLGVTPSAWGSIAKVFETQGGSLLSYGTNQLLLANNAYFNGTNWIYKTTGQTASYYQQLDASGHRWFTASSGTAGNPIAFTQAMTLDASGNLLVGGTIQLYGASGRGLIQVSGSSQALLGFGTTGNVGLGFLYHSGTTFELTNAQNGYLSFGTNNLERARFTNVGAFWLGRTTDLGGAQILVEGSVADFQSRIRNTSATTPAGLFLHYTAAAPNGTGSLFLRCDDNAATRVEIRSNGGLANFSANNVNLSDARLKTGIQLAGDYLAKICAIPVKTFLYRDQQDDERNLGVIAQDVAAVAPELVDHGGFGQAPEGEAPYLAIYQTDLQYALMRAIQELAARVHELERA